MNRAGPGRLRFELMDLLRRVAVVPLLALARVPGLAVLVLVLVLAASAAANQDDVEVAADRRPAAVVRLRLVLGVPAASGHRTRPLNAAAPGVGLQSTKQRNTRAFPHHSTGSHTAQA